MDFKLHSEYAPTGDQPQAIDELSNGVMEGVPYQTLLGVTGSGKTFTMANIIQRTGAYAHSVAQQDARCPTLQRVQEFFPRKLGALLRVVLRLLSA